MRIISAKINKVAFPARMGEIDSITHPMPVKLTDQAKENCPIYDKDKMKKLVNGDNFLEFMFSSIGEGEEALLEIFEMFVLENKEYCKKYEQIDGNNQYK